MFIYYRYNNFITLHYTHPLTHDAISVFYCVFYTVGLSSGFYGFSLNHTEVPYGCWFSLINYDPKIYTNCDKRRDIYINTGKKNI